MPDPLAARLKLLRGALQQRAREERESGAEPQVEAPGCTLPATRARPCAAGSESVK